jgi:hypothetical protein
LESNLWSKNLGSEKECEKHLDEDVLKDWANADVGGAQHQLRRDSLTDIEAEPTSPDLSVKVVSSMIVSV